MVVDDLREPAQQPGTVGGGHCTPPGGSSVCGRDGRVGLLEAREGDAGHHGLGGGVDDVVQGVAHSRSNPLIRSQSVTAPLKAASSTSAAWA